MRRLYLHIYLAFVGIVILFVVLASIAWFVSPWGQEDRRVLDGMARLLGEILPSADRPIAELQQAVEQLSEEFDSDLAITSAGGTMLATAGAPVPAPNTEHAASNWLRGPGPTVALRLPDGRWLVARHRHRHGGRWLAVLMLLAIAIAVGAYPVARRITGRLERLQTQVDQLGAGDLTTRVEVEGKDEVANLARSFNRAADRIERLVAAKGMMLASASHELRTPLARIRMAIELLSGDDRPELREKIAEDITELDELIDDLLLASRLEAIDGLERTEDVDLLALVAEEGARAEATVSGTPVRVNGDARMLRRLVRNLFENAHRHGQGTPIEATVKPSANSSAMLLVADKGPGVPEEEREKIFEPFYRPVGMREGADPGVGLGLSLVRQIAERHGGSARCLPREGGGTCFEVRFSAE